MSETFYTTLGVSENASKEEIKKAYRALQMKYHPDKNQGSAESMSMTQKLNEAYETLGDEEKREDYDIMQKHPFFNGGGGGGGGGGHMEVPMDELFTALFGINPFAGMRAGGTGGRMRTAAASASASASEEVENIDIFQNIMEKNGFRGKVHIVNGGPIHFTQSLQKPPPIIKQINISIAQVLTGATVPLQIERWIFERGLKVFEKETIYVTVPKGIDDGELVILRDSGNMLNEQCKGDVKIFVKVDNDSVFTRAGLDLIIAKKITLKEALTGFSFEIKYINGKTYTLNNNPGNIITPGFRKVIPNMGLERDQHKGNMIVEFAVEFPEKLTESQMKLIQTVLE